MPSTNKLLIRSLPFIYIFEIVFLTKKTIWASKYFRFWQSFSRVIDTFSLIGQPSRNNIKLTLNYFQNTADKIYYFRYLIFYTQNKDKRLKNNLKSWKKFEFLHNQRSLIVPVERSHLKFQSVTRGYPSSVPDEFPKKSWCV